MEREEQIRELTRRIDRAAVKNLQCAVLYGSAATDDFHRGYSDLNVLCVLRDASAGPLHQLSPTIAWWTKHKNPPPVILAADELARDAEMFPIEMLDIKHHHRVLVGDDIFATLEIPLRLHRIQVEHELRTKLQLLRQRYAAGAQVIDLMANSISGFLTLFRHALIALGIEPPHGRAHVVAAAAQKASFDDTPFTTILRFRRGELKSRDIDAHATFAAYVTAIERVTNLVAALPFSRELCT